MRSEMLRRYNISDQDYKLIETVIIESRPHKAGPQWKFSGAFYFSVVVVALIGKYFIVFFKKKFKVLNFLLCIQDMAILHLPPLAGKHFASFTQ